MSLSPEDDFAAAEFALGTLDPAERAAIAARRLREPALEAAIRVWEERLAPLAEAAPPIEPPRDYFSDIQARIRAPAPAAAPIRPPPADEAMADLKGRVARWRAAAIGAASLAASVARSLGSSVPSANSAARESSSGERLMTASNP